MITLQRFSSMTCARQTAIVGGATVESLVWNVLLLVVNTGVLVARMPEKKKGNEDLFMTSHVMS